MRGFERQYLSESAFDLAKTMKSSRFRHTNVDMIKSTGLYYGTLYYKFKSMKTVVTGSLGNISKPLVQELLQKGHDVTVISSLLFKLLRDLNY